MRSPLAAIIKTLLDQTIMAPAGIGLFFYAMSLLEGSCPADAMIAARERFKPTLMANYALWPAANLINFAFVPPSQRILYVNVIYVSRAQHAPLKRAPYRCVCVCGVLLPFVMSFVHLNGEGEGCNPLAPSINTHAHSNTHSP